MGMVSVELGLPLRQGGLANPLSQRTKNRAQKSRSVTIAKAILFPSFYKRAWGGRYSRGLESFPKKPFARGHVGPLGIDLTEAKSLYTRLPLCITLYYRF
jgi:hypothetical protein